ncbi:hypothetical protein PPERSA_08607 [Pseudocohnilembus persalinus]|uniref:Uncharacterized protein n=1 Tax=Pseudocohnilembus persalinus TaxID=266149 RepID=A0A0V0R2J3_PSEPJ|nr:hypothetical protein PPERSA_08607 [Pseudocohnilembus persalinus]|eukprot:KRX08408.1 hypothetical protein PPERSA_08607 [Pseudocohnilembus persalinus]
MTDATQQISESEQQIQQQNKEQNNTENKQPQQQQQQQQQQQSQQSDKKIHEQVQVTLKKLFSQGNFLRNKYLITNCQNKDLDVAVINIISHNKFEELSQQIFNLSQNPLLFPSLVQEEIGQCDYIKYDASRQIARPNFHRERNTIYLAQVQGSQIEELKKFIEQNEEFKFYTQEELDNIKKQKEENPTLQIEKLKKFKTHVNKDNTVSIIADNEQLASNLFNWLFGKQFNGIELNQLQIQEYDYYYFAYKELFGKDPSGFRNPMSIQQQQAIYQQQKLQQIQMQMQITQQQQSLQFNNSQRMMQNKYQQGGYAGKGRYQNYNKNYQRPHNNNYYQNQQGNSNYQGQQGGKPRHFKKGGSNDKFNRQNKYRGNNQSQPRSTGYNQANMEDKQEFPGL